MAAYFNRNLRLLRKALDKKRGRPIGFDYLAMLVDFPSIKLQQWERDGEPNLAELRKLAEKYSKILETEITTDQIINRDLRYDERFSKLAWGM
ncbi:hypothetical protein J7L68_07265 [bacterium]|nr:hypothetical protein [bacterium]